MARLGLCMGIGARAARFVHGHRHGYGRRTWVAWWLGGMGPSADCGRAVPSAREGAEARALEPEALEGRPGGYGMHSPARGSLAVCGASGE